ncbi:MAG: HlyD family type I secretion periplasmic adaptor subunit [Pontibacterium sp.]
MKKEELQFLPAAIEIQDTPPAPAGRAIIWSISIFFVLAVAWSIYGELDIVSVAQGKVIPVGHSKTVQPFEAGTIQEIHVAEGQQVKQGEVLISLNDEALQADLRRIEFELTNTFYELSRLEQFVQWLENKSESNPPLPDYNNTELAGGPIATLSNDTLEGLPEGVRHYPPAQKRHQLLLTSQQQEYNDRNHSLSAEAERVKAEKRMAEQQVKKLEAILPIIERRTESYQELKEKRVIAEQEFLRFEQQRLEYVHDLLAQRHQVSELEQGLQEIDARRRHMASEYLSQAMASLQDAERRYAGLTEEHQKGLTQLSHTQLTSPIDGVVEQLSVHTLGGVVTPAQELMKVVPFNQTLMVEAMVANKDVGFVEEGQRVVVKVDAFPFTKYGLLEGEITNLSDDAIADEQLGFIYKAQVALNATALPVNGKSVTITPGMTVMLEAQTGKRRVVEYFLAPLLKAVNESVRER